MLWRPACLTAAQNEWFCRAKPVSGLLADSFLSDRMRLWICCRAAMLRSLGRAGCAGI